MSIFLEDFKFIWDDSLLKYNPEFLYKNNTKIKQLNPMLYHLSHKRLATSASVDAAGRCPKDGAANGNKGVARTEGGSKYNEAHAMLGLWAFAV